MPRPSPFARGFRSLRREPSVLLAEIAWRWLFGGIATVLLIWATLVFLRAIEVSKANQFLLRTFNPEIIRYVMRDLLQHKWELLARLGLIVSVSLSFLWILTAAIARTATTRVLLDQSADSYGQERDTHVNLRTVGALQLIRVALLWIGLAAYVLSALIASRVNPNGDHIGAFLLVFFTLFLIAAMVLSFFNWLLLLAPIFALRDGERFSNAILAAWQLTRDRAGSLVALNLAHLALRLIWIVFISGIGLAPVGFVHIVPKIVIFLAVAATTPLYCAVADALFVARYAGYIEIAEQQLHPDPVFAGPASEFLTPAHTILLQAADPQLPEARQEIAPDGVAEVSPQSTQEDDESPH
jgi:hypothetical protein